MNRFYAWATDDEEAPALAISHPAPAPPPASAPQILVPAAVPQQLVLPQPPSQVYPSGFGPVPAPAYAAHGAYAPPQQSILVAVPGYGVGGIKPVEFQAPPAQTCVIVKRDAESGDIWARRMSQVPDLTAMGVVPDLSGGVDVARDYSGIPEFAAMGSYQKEGWGPNSRYYNGVTDRTAKGSVNAGVGRHGDSIEGVRSSSSRSLGTGAPGYDGSF